MIIWPRFRCKTNSDLLRSSLWMWSKFGLIKGSLQMK